MISLNDHKEFESVRAQKEPIVIVKFGATWCGPCKRIDKQHLLDFNRHIKWYDCDIDDNYETTSICGIKSIPAFVAIVRGNPEPVFQSSDTNAVINWIENNIIPLVEPSPSF